jgi:hypothetical protein
MPVGFQWTDRNLDRSKPNCKFTGINSGELRVKEGKKNVKRSNVLLVGGVYLNYLCIKTTDNPKIRGCENAKMKIPKTLPKERHVEK